MRSVFERLSVFLNSPLMWCILVVLLILVYIFARRSRSIKRVRSMTDRQQVDKINELAGPFGFYYESGEEIFSSRRDAWQREMGYQALFDRAAVLASMVIDAQPIYFDYVGKTWLVEFWKGQYGINAGGEVGVYHAKSIVQPQEYADTNFSAVKDSEMPIIRSRLLYVSRNKEKSMVLFEHQARHWWLTGFALGKHAQPKKLVLQSAIEFQNEDMAEAFIRGARNAQTAYFQTGREGSRVYIVFGHGESIARSQRLLRCMVLMWNQLLVRLFLFVTKPFCNPAEKLLYLYYRFPRCFRRLLRFGRKVRRNGGAG